MYQMFPFGGSGPRILLHTAFQVTSCRRKKISEAAGTLWGYLVHQKNTRERNTNGDPCERYMYGVGPERYSLIVRKKKEKKGGAMLPLKLVYVYVESSVGVL